MFLRNYYKILSSTRVETTADQQTGIVLPDGKEVADFYWYTIDSYAASYLLAFSQLDRLLKRYKYDFGVLFGTGTTPPSGGDYALSGDIVDTITVSNVRSHTVDDSGDTLTMVYTITNTGDTDITIGEVGLIAPFQYACTASNNRKTVYPLIERTVLDKPITIPSGGVGQVTYTIRMNYPTA